MQESRQDRIAKLTELVGRQRRQLTKLMARTAPENNTDQLSTQMAEIEDQLRKAEDELHQLRVQQIRAELTEDHVE